MKKEVIVVLLMIFAVDLSASENEVIDVFGPGGPAPAMKEAAEAFKKKENVEVRVVSGPTSNWKAEALTKADLIYSGSENMMDSFVAEKLVMPTTIETLFLRPSAILVRPGNPKKISGVRDLIKKEAKTIVVNGAGQVGMWEDIVGRIKNAESLNQFRKQIVFAGQNTGEAEKYWNENRDVDAWLVFNVWGTRTSNKSQIVPVEEELAIYRSCGIASSSKSRSAGTKKFISFLKEGEGAKIFEKYGWFRR